MAFKRKKPDSERAASLSETSGSKDDEGEPAPHWETWGLFVTATLAQAVALSCDLAPDDASVRRLTHLEVLRATDSLDALALIQSPPPFEAYRDDAVGERLDEFIKRFRIAANHVQAGSPETSFGSVEGSLRLDDFARWAEALRWKLPSRFPRHSAARAQDRTGAIPNPNPSGTESIAIVARQLGPGGGDVNPQPGPPESLPKPYQHLTQDLQRFLDDDPFDRSVFVMMKFPDLAHMESWQIKCVDEIFAAARDELDRHGLVARRADKKTYAQGKQLWENLCIYMLGCRYGVAILEDHVGDELNPNVALEYGFMKGLGREVILLKERRFKHLRADLVGTIS